MRNKALSILTISVVIFVTLFLAGCKQTTPEKNRLSLKKKPFEITNLVFCSQEPAGYMEYVEQPDATYKPGDAVWLYMNIKGVKFIKNQDKTNEIWISEHLTLKGPDGKVYLDGELLNDHRNLSPELDPNKLFLRNKITTTPQLEEGKYTVIITVEDKLAKKKASASSSFILKK